MKFGAYSYWFRLLKEAPPRVLLFIAHIMEYDIKRQV